MRQIKGLKYSIDSKKYFSGIPFFRKLKRVKFLIEKKQIAEFTIDKNQYLISFSDADKIEIICKNKIGTEFNIIDISSNQTWIFSESNNNFSFKKEPPCLIKSNESEIKINNHNGSFLYSIEEKLIGRIEDKNIFFLFEIETIDVLSEEHSKILIAAYCLELIRRHIFKVYEPI